MSASEFDYRTRVGELLRELGIPGDYGTVRGLDLQEEASRVVLVAKAESGKECRLIPRAAEAWFQMRDQARNSGVELIPLSGFRSVERQTEIIRGKLALGESVNQILRSMAAPGFSEHHTGRAIDIGTPGIPPLEEAFSSSAAYAWLARHAGEFGFSLSYPRNNPYGFVFEPWHWCWRE